MKKPFQLLFLAVISALTVACSPKEDIIDLPFGRSHDEIIDILKKEDVHIIHDDPRDISAVNYAGFDLYGLKWYRLGCGFNRDGELSYLCFTDYQAGLDKTESEQLIADISSKYGNCEERWKSDEFDGHKYLQCTWEMEPVVVFLSLQEDETHLTFNHIDYVAKMDITSQDIAKSED